MRIDVVFDTAGALSLSQCASMMKSHGMSLHIVPEAAFTLHLRGSKPEEAAPTQMFVVTAFAPRRGSHKKRIVVRQGNYPSMSDGSVWRFCERQRREMCAHRFHEL